MHEPPDDLPAALVPSLLAQRVVAGGDQLAATLFELVRRGRFTMTHVTREESSFAGLRHKEIDDVDLARGDESIELAVVEKPVAAIFDQPHRGEGPSRSRRSRRPSRSCRTADREWFHGRSEAFESAVRNQARQRVFWSGRGMLVKWLSFAAFLLVGGGLLALGIAGLADPPLVRRDLVITAAGAALALNALVVLLLPAPMWRRRRPAMQAAAEQWEGFRRYLDDFPRLADKPADTLPLWERYLVYGITFGIAERVLEAAQRAVPGDLRLVRLRAGALRRARSAPRASRATSAARSPRPRAAARAAAGRGGGGSFGGGGGGAGSPMSDELHRALQAAAVEADAEAQRRLLAGDPAGAEPFLRESERLYRESWEAAPPGGYGRLVGMLKAAILHGDAAARPPTRGRRSTGEPGRRPPPTRSRWPAWPPATTRPPPRRPRRWPPAERPSSARRPRWRRWPARDEAGLCERAARRDRGLRGRELHLTGVAIADTALVLERLAGPRGLAQRPVSPLLP